MPYTNDMSTLADVVSPVDAAMQSGQQAGNQNIQDAIQTQIKQSTMPQEIQKASLNNALLQAQGQAEQGVAAQQQAAGLTALQGQPSASQAGIAGNQAKLSGSQLENLGNLGQTVNKLSDFMEQVPAPARPAMMAHYLDQQNITDPGIRQAVASGDPAMLRQIGLGLIQHSQSYVQGMAEIAAKGSEQRANTALEQTGQTERTGMLVGSKAEVANINKSAKAMLVKTDNIIAQLTAKQSQGALTPDEALTLNQARQAQQLSKTNPFINQMLQPDASADTNQMPVAQPGSVGTPPPAGNALQAEMRKRGLLK